jgi:hypothetical protein
MTTPAQDQRCRVGLCFLPFSANPGIFSRLLAMPSTVIHVPRAPTATHQVQCSVCNAHPALTATRLLLSPSQRALPVLPLRSATAQVFLMHPPAACAFQVPTRLCRVLPLACPANPDLTLSRSVSNTATFAKRVLTASSMAPARDRHAACALLEHFQKMDR